jgi:molecular chaperone GrpE
VSVSEEYLTPRNTSRVPPGKGGPQAVPPAGPTTSAPQVPAGAPAETESMLPAGAGDGRLRNELKETRRELFEAIDRVKTAEESAEEANEKYLRLAAEFENLRKRHRQEQLERLQYANSELLVKLLPLLDNFDRALEHAPTREGAGAIEQWVNGMLLVERQFRELLESEGVVPIESVGQQFDPNFHQAVMADPSPDHEDGTITQELQRGYTLHDRVLRPSMVKVARNS